MKISIYQNSQKYGEWSGDSTQGLEVLEYLQRQVRENKSLAVNLGGQLLTLSEAAGPILFKVEEEKE